MSLDLSDTMELQDRFASLMSEYASMSVDIASRLEKFGKVRSEMQLILVELKKRGTNAQLPEELKKSLEEKLNSHNAKNTENQGNTESR